MQSNETETSATPDLDSRHTSVKITRVTNGFVVEEVEGKMSARAHVETCALKAASRMLQILSKTAGDKGKRLKLIQTADSFLEEQ